MINTTEITKELIEIARIKKDLSGLVSHEKIAISGKDLKGLMRASKVTIDDIKQAHGVTKKRIREVREKGLKGFAAVNFIFLITGVWIA